MISFSFDDFPRSALRVGGSILRQHGFFATYYASLGLLGRQTPTGTAFSQEDLRELVDQGHELGCHTFGHCDAWETPPDAFERAIQENRRVLNERLPGATMGTFSYPVSMPRPANKRIAIGHFSCCRGGGQLYNAGTADAACLKSFFLERSRDSVVSVLEVMRETCRRGGWLILSTHDVDEQPTRFGCAPRFFAEVVEHAAQSGARVLPVAEAWRALSNPPAPAVS